MKNKSFPQATKSIAKAKLDLKEWGYCLLKDAIPVSYTHLRAHETR